MKKALVVFGGLVIIFILVANSCFKGSTGEIKAALNQEVRLPIGETLVISDEGLKIRFVAVTNDSRCAQGVTCIWAGEAKCKTEFTLGNSKDLVDITITGSGVSQTIFHSYTIQSILEPYPKAEQTIQQSSYILVMKIIK